MNMNLEHNLRHKDYIGKYVKVQTVNSREHEGWLKCIDPMTGNLILIVFDECFKTVLDAPHIQGHAYNSIEVLKEDDSVKKRLENLYNEHTLFNSESLCDRKQRLMSWIQKHKLPVGEENEKLIVAGKVIIGPPYLMGNCKGVNRVFLRNIAKLVSEMPKDYKAETHKLTAESVIT